MQISNIQSTMSVDIDDIVHRLNIPPPAVYTVLGLTLIALLYRIFLYDSRRRYLPPGPRGWPIIGNTFQMNLFDKPAPQLLKWTKQYGDLFHLKIGGSHFIFVNSPTAVKALFDRKGAIYSDKTHMPMAGDAYTKGMNIVLMGYTQKFKTYRRLIQGVLTTKQAETYRPVQEYESKQMAYDLLNSPDNYYDLTRRYASSLIMQVVYGRRFPTPSSPEAEQIYECNKRFSAVAGPGMYRVDTFPILAKIPGYGTIFGNWRKKGEELFQLDAKIFLTLYRKMKAEMIQKVGFPCFAKDLELSNPAGHGLTELDSAYLTAALVQPGGESTAALLNWLIRALVEWTEIQVTAREELDKVVGSERTPIWEDEKNLPYIRAMVKELLRWALGSKFGMPHAAGQDDWYEGMFIPKGAFVVIGQVSLHFDEKRFPEPFRYNPMHYYGTRYNDITAFQGMNAADPADRDHWAYGAGRRWCPGIHLAEKSLFLNIARLMWGFDFQKSGDEGVDWDPCEPDEGWLNLPKKFNPIIRPRSAKHAEVIRREWEEAQAKGLKYDPAPRELFAKKE